MKGVNLFLADGFEDIEAVATRDILDRGGVNVTLVSINHDKFVISAHNLTVEADCTLYELLSGGFTSGLETSVDFMIFPGGMPGSRNLGECHELIDLMNEHYARGGSVAAICAAPSFVLGKLKGVESAEFTCYDGCQTALVSKGARFLKRPAVTSGRIITGRGPGYADDFALAILEYIKGFQAADGVKAGMYLSCED